MEYYYTTPDGQTRGPASVDEIRALLQTGALNESCKVAAVGSQEWQPITSVISAGGTSAGTPTSSSAPTAAATPVTPQVSSSAPTPSAVYAQPPPGRTDPLATWSLILSLVGLFCCSFFTSIPGIICGHIALSHMKADPNLGGKGMATAGLAIGYFATFGWIIYLFVMGGLSVLRSFGN